MEGTPKCYYRTSVKALILNETRDKFLIVKEDNGKWDFPGGGMDYGESPKDCLKRELMEEMGLEVSTISDSPLYFFTGQFQREDLNGKWYSNVFYEVTLPSLSFTPSSECVKVRFVSPEEIATLPVYNSVTSLASLFKKH